LLATPADPCDFSRIQPLIAGDNFLLGTVNAIMSSKAWRGNSVIFITWDRAISPVVYPKNLVAFDF